MDILTLIDLAGGVGALARRLGVAHNTVSDWKRNGFIPGSRLSQVRGEFGLSAEAALNLARQTVKEAA